MSYKEELVSSREICRLADRSTVESGSRNRKREFDEVQDNRDGRGATRKENRGGKETERGINREISRRTRVIESRPAEMADR